MAPLASVELLEYIKPWKLVSMG